MNKTSRQIRPKQTRLPNPFAGAGQWYKGNTHIHTTHSDGDLAPDKICALYAAAGYDFIFITDHDKLTDITGLSSKRLAVFPGMELEVGVTELGNYFHLVALGIRQAIPCGHKIDAQQAVNAALKQDGVVIIAHPYWSQLTVRDMLNLRGPVGCEVYNTSCEYSISKGFSCAWWDELLLRGNVVWGLAADDAHYHFNDHRPVDTCGAWIMVKAESPALKNILAAVRNGDFYASNGPEIKNVVVRKDTVRVECSPVRIINFIAQQGCGERFTAPVEQRLAGAEYRFKGDEKFVRIECVDFQGKFAWTNPVYVK